VIWIRKIETQQEHCEETAKKMVTAKKDEIRGRAKLPVEKTKIASTRLTKEEHDDESKQGEGKFHKTQHHHKQKSTKSLGVTSSKTRTTRESEGQPQEGKSCDLIKAAKKTRKSLQQHHGEVFTIQIIAYASASNKPRTQSSTGRTQLPARGIR
jgi:hypothetical protein